MTITFTIPNPFAGIAGPTEPLSSLDENFDEIQSALSGLVAAMTDLPLAVNATGTRAWGQGVALNSASPLNLGSDGNYFLVNGTTGITSISTKQAGCIIILRFAAALTLTHSANLILMGASNATTAAGDLYWFISDGGGIWRELWRRPVTGALVTNVMSGVGTWITPPTSGVTIVKKAAQTQAVNASTTLVNDDALLYALAGAQSIMFRCVLWQVGNSTADFKLTFTVPAAATIRWNFVNGLQVSTAAAIQQYTTITASASTQATSSDTTPQQVTVEGYVLNDATPGNLQLQWAQQTSEAVDTKVLIGSRLEVFP